MNRTPALAPERKVISRCLPCDLPIYETGGLKKHKRTKAHIDRCIEEGLHCPPCKKTFVNRDEKESHLISFHNLHGESVFAGVSVSNSNLWGHATSRGSSSTMDPPPLAPPDMTVVTRCIPCGLSIYETGGFKEHKKTTAHIDKCIEVGLYCVPCKKAFLNTTGKDKHYRKYHNPNASSVSVCPNCGVIFSKDKLGKQYRNHATENGSTCSTNPIRPPERKAISRCLPCDLPIYETGGLKKHKRTKAHIDRCIEEGLYCIPCKKGFESKNSTENHNKQFHDPTRAFEFGCLECGQSFSSNSTLKKHTRGHAPKLEVFSCEPCGKEYNKRWDLHEHLRSESHLRLKCFGGSACDRTFATPSAMIMHLESGVCKSKIDRKGIDQLLQQHDTTNIITITGAPAVAQQLPAELPRLITAHHVIFEVLSDSDSDSETGVILTPTSSRSPFFSGHNNSTSISEDGVLLTPSSDPPSRRDSTHSNADSSFIPDGAHTPSSGAGFSEVEFPGGLMARLICPVCKKKFSSPIGLQMHVSSPVHSLPIYHCPLSFLELGAEGKKRNFKTLSALVQHLEHGSCEGGVETFRKAMEYVQGRMITLGLGNMQLLEYVQTSSV